jgi:glutaredoxin
MMFRWPSVLALLSRCRLLAFLLLSAGCCGHVLETHATTAATIEVFSRAGCPHCEAAQSFLVTLRHELPGVVVVEHDVMADAAALARLRRLAETYHAGPPGVPAFLIGDAFLIGFESPATTGQWLRRQLAAAGDGGEQRKAADDAQPQFQIFGWRLDEQRMGLALFSVALGLIDGFNPCSMWVLVFMLAMLAPLRDRRRMLLVMGSFVAVEGLAYFAFMAAWMNVFATLGVSRLSTVLVGIVGCAMGLIHLKDYFALGRGITLSIPQSAKPGIYARIRRIVTLERAGTAIAATMLLALLVQAVEFLCTAGIPALFTRILTLHALPVWQYYSYMALYVLMYMIDDFVVLGIGVVTLSRQRLQADAGRWLKLLSGVVLLSLGTYLLLRAP